MPSTMRRTSCLRSLPEKAPFQLVATTEHGEAMNDFGPPIQKQTDGRALSLKGGTGKGPETSISTERGSVLVEAPPAASPAPAPTNEKF